METKSRYEILKELTERKEALIIEKRALPNDILKRKEVIRIMKRDTVDKEAELKVIEERLKTNEETYDMLIGNIQKSIDSLNGLQSHGK